MLLNRTIVFACTESHTLYVAVPVDKGHHVHRMRQKPRRGDRAAEFRGRLLSVCQPADPRRELLRCGASLWNVVRWEGQAPRVGLPIAACDDASEKCEVSSPVRWVATTDIDRVWIVSQVLRAHGNGATDEDLKALVAGPEFENGDEGIEDTTAGIRALRKFYQGYLRSKVAERNREFQAKGLVPPSRSIAVPNDRPVGLAKALLDAPGPGFELLDGPWEGSLLDRRDLSRSIDVMLATTVASICSLQILGEAA